MFLSEIKTISDLYKSEEIYDNPYTAICNSCLQEFPVIKEYWHPSVIKYIKSDKCYYPYHCKKCKRLDAKIYNTRLKKSTPKYANLNKIKEIYANCPEGYEVDHIIPLNGSVVSGLHIETNLQYLSVKENRKKSNNFCI